MSRRSLQTASSTASTLAMLALAVVPALAQNTGIFDQQADWGPRGTAKVEGSASFSDGTYTLEGNGDDIWNEDDEGFYLYTEVTGSWTLQGQFTWVDPGANDWAKLGPMIRAEGNSATSVNYYAAMRGALDLISPQWRAEDGAASGSFDPRIQDRQGQMIAPQDSSIWLRMSRLQQEGDDLVLVEWSRDGEQWNFGHSRELDLPDTVAFGIAITNHDDNDFLAQGTASNVELTEFTDTVVSRSFTSDFATEGESIGVNLSVLANPGTVTLTETLPDGWSAAEVSNEGTVSGNEITWELDASTTEVSYTAEIPVGFETSIFSGNSGAVSTVGPNQFTILLQGFRELGMHADIGGVGLPGEVEDLDPTFVVRGSGADIWGTADQMHFMFTELQNGFTISGISLLFPLDGDPTWTKGGLMVRDNLTAGASNVFFHARNDEQIRWQVRPEQDAETGSGGFVTADEQDGGMEITRVGDAYNLYYINVDGERVFYDTVTVPMDEPVYVGIAITSHNNEAISEIWVDDLQIEERPFMISRSVSATAVEPGDTIDVTVTVAVREGDTVDAALEEAIPNGFNLESFEASSGEASEADGALTWTLSGAEGEHTLNYTLSVGGGASAVAQISGSFDGGGDFSGSSGSTNITVNQDVDLGLFAGNQDIGDVAASGFVSRDGDAWQVVGSGVDIWSTADEFHYLYQRVEGDFTFSIDNPFIGGFDVSPSGDDWQKMGIMARQSLDASSAYAFAMLRSSDQAYMLQWREEDGIDAAWEDGSQVTADVWNPDFNEEAAGVNQPGLDVFTRGGTIQLARQGETFTANYLIDGEVIPVISHDVVMEDPIYIGVGVTAHDDGSLSQGLFDNPQFEGSTVSVQGWMLY